MYEKVINNTYHEIVYARHAPRQTVYLHRLDPLLACFTGFIPACNGGNVSKESDEKEGTRSISFSRHQKV